MTSTYLADLSEFQPNVADGTYLHWSKAVIIRACYGDAHDDKAWYGGQRRAQLHSGGARFVGIYQYLVAGQPGAAQAQAFHKLVGAIQPGEVFIADFEEGSRSVLTSWLNAMVSLYGTAIRPYLWVYTYLSFGEAQGVLPVEWLADYTSQEPSSPHQLWQFTDKYNVPGVGTADCSVFRGTIDQLAALAYQPAKPAPKPPAQPVQQPQQQEEQDMAIEIPPGATTPDVGVSFNGAPYSTIGFLADPSRVGATSVEVRCAFHKGATASFTVATATMTPAAPKVIVAVPAECDGVSFRRLDSAPLTLYPNFA